MTKSLVKRFRAELLGGHKDAAVETPFNPTEVWGIPPIRLRPGRNGHQAQGTLNGVEFKSAIVPRSKKFFLLVDEELQKLAKIELGDVVSVSIEPIQSAAHNNRAVNKTAFARQLTKQWVSTL